MGCVGFVGSCCKEILFLPFKDTKIDDLMKVLLLLHKRSKLALKAPLPKDFPEDISPNRTTRKPRIPKDSSQTISYQVASVNAIFQAPIFDKFGPLCPCPSPDCLALSGLGNGLRLRSDGLHPSLCYSASSGLSRRSRTFMGRRTSTYESSIKTGDLSTKGTKGTKFF